MARPVANIVAGKAVGPVGFGLMGEPKFPTESRGSEYAYLIYNATLT